MKTVYLSWQDPKNRQWFPVGKLTHEDGIYRFVYTEGAKRSLNFRPFGRMQGKYQTPVFMVTILVGDPRIKH